MNILELLDSGGMIALAVIVWFEVKAVRVTLEKLNGKLSDLFTKDIESRTATAAALGETLGRIDARLQDIALDSREARRASGSDTRHPPARIEEYPSSRTNSQ